MSDCDDISSDEELLLLSASWYVMQNGKQKPLPHRSMYIRPILARRPQLSEYANLVQEMRAEDPKEHKSYFRMDQSAYDTLFGRVEESITHPPTHRHPISANERFALTLR